MISGADPRAQPPLLLDRALLPQERARAAGALAAPDAALRRRARPTPSLTNLPNVPFPTQTRPTNWRKLLLDNTQTGRTCGGRTPVTGITSLSVYQLIYGIKSA